MDVDPKGLIFETNLEDIDPFSITPAA